MNTLKMTTMWAAMIFAALIGTVAVNAAVSFGPWVSDDMMMFARLVPGALLGVTVVVYGMVAKNGHEANGFRQKKAARSWGVTTVILLVGMALLAAYVNGTDFNEYRRSMYAYAGFVGVWLVMGVVFSNGVTIDRDDD